MTRTTSAYRVTTHPAKVEPTGIDLASAAQSYLLSCRSRNLSAETVALYAAELGQLDRYLAAQRMPRDITAIRREHLEAFLLDLHQRGMKPSTVSMAFRSMRTFWGWAVSEDEVPVSPMQRMKAIVVPEDPPAILSDGETDRLMAKLNGRDFESRRDRAIVLMLIDCGIRRGELCAMDVEDVDLRLRVAKVKGKARIWRPIALGDTTVEAIDRYLRARGRHSHAADPALWLGTKGRLGPSGVMIMLRRRGALAGIPKLHAHQFRHGWANSMLAAGATEGDVMALGGWRSRDMLSRYGGIARSERAIEAHRKLSPADRLRRK